MSAATEPDRPFAFTRADAWTGAAWAWAAFMVLMLLALIATAIVSGGTWSSYLGIVLFYALLLGGMVSMVVMFVLLPVFWGVAVLLRGVRPVAVHLVVHGLLGATIGIAAVAVYAAFMYDPAATLASPLLPITVAITGAAVLIGWWRGSRRVRRMLKAEDPRSPIEVNDPFRAGA